MDNRWTHEEYEAINRVVCSGNYTMGTEVEAFEKEVSKYFDSKFAVMVNSGSSANLIAVASLIFSEKYDLKKGDEVIVPSVSWGTTYSPLQQYGLKLKFVDVDIDTLNLNLDEIEKAITKNTKMIFAVNLLGNCINYNRLIEICEKHNLILVEDNCESMGSKFDGKFAGTFGIIGTMSSFYSHHISTMEGGIALTDDEELYNIMRSLRAHGWSRNIVGDFLSDINDIHNDFYRYFNFILPGYNLRPLEIEAAIGREQIKKLSEFVKIRRKNADLYKRTFNDHPYIKIQKETGESSWFAFPFIINDSAPYKRDEIVAKLGKKKIFCRPIVAGNFVTNPAIKYYDYVTHNELKNSDIIHKNGLMVYNSSSDMSDTFQMLEQIFYK